MNNIIPHASQARDLSKCPHASDGMKIADNIWYAIRHDRRSCVYKTTVKDDSNNSGSFSMDFCVMAGDRDMSYVDEIMDWLRSLGYECKKETDYTFSHVCLVDIHISW
jgi:hypothetical protein